MTIPAATEYRPFVVADLLPTAGDTLVIYHAELDLYNTQLAQSSLALQLSASIDDWTGTYIMVAV